VDEQLIDPSVPSRETVGSRHSAEGILHAIGLAVNRKDHSITGAYIIEHPHTGLLYVGSTCNLYRRLHGHAISLMKGTHRSKKLQAAFDVHPKLTIKFKSTKTREEAYDVEQFFLDKLAVTGTLTNTALDARLNGKGVSRSPEHRVKITNGLMQYYASDENKRNHGKAVSEALMKPECVELRRRNTQKYWQNPEYRAKHVGKKRTSEARDKIRIAKLKTWQDPNYRENFKAANSIPITIDGVTYPSYAAAASFYGIKYKTFHRRIVTGYKGWVIGK